MNVSRWLSAFACVLLLSACEPATPPEPVRPVLRILAGSELKDIEPLIAAAEAQTGLAIELQYAGTLDALDQLQGGGEYDVAWLANARYALLNPELRQRIKASERTMISPVVLGVKAGKARALGWDDPAQPPTWADVAKAAGEGQFRFAMTNPASSNTGFSAVLGLAAAIAGKGDALELADIDRDALTGFARAQALTAGSSGWLAEAYVREQDRLDGIVNYASVLHGMNLAGTLREPLTLVYPRDGVITADYPLLLLNEARRSDYDTLAAYLKSEPFQRAMTGATHRQPIVATVPSGLPPRDYFELAFPARLAVIDGVLDAYQNEFRRPADSTFVVDVSGSMADYQRIDQLRAALEGLAGQDATLSGRFSRFRDRERIAVLSFSNEVHARRLWELGTDAAANASTLRDVGAFARSLQIEGGTAIYSAVQDGYSAALARQAGDPDRIYSLVVMTDGENNAGIELDAFREWFARLPEAQRRIRIFAVQFGEARRDELEAMTKPTGGRVFNANKVGLRSAFKEIRGYQ